MEPQVAKKILIVEDDQYIREALHELLEGEGHPVMSASNGQEAIDLLRASDSLPGLILLDLMMPIKDGFAFREEQQNDPRLSNIPVVIMSADGNVFEKKNRTHAADYLRKPVEVDVVLDVIKRYNH